MEKLTVFQDMNIGYAVHYHPEAAIWYFQKGIHVINYDSLSSSTCHPDLFTFQVWCYGISGHCLFPSTCSTYSHNLMNSNQCQSKLLPKLSQYFTSQIRCTVVKAFTRYYLKHWRASWQVGKIQITF